MLGWLAGMVDLIINKLNSLLSGQAALAQSQHTANAELAQSLTLLSQALATLNQVLANTEKIIVQLTPPPPAAAILTLTLNGEINMAKTTLATTLDLQLPDSGSGTATLSFVDAAGLPAVVPTTSTVATTWTSSSPAVVVTPSTINPLVAAFAPSTPPQLATGIVITAAVTITDPTLPTINLTATGEPIDVIAGGIAGVQMVETEP